MSDAPIGAEAIEELGVRDTIDHARDRLRSVRQDVADLEAAIREIDAAAVTGCIDATEDARDRDMLAAHLRDAMDQAAAWEMRLQELDT